MNKEFIESAYKQAKAQYAELGVDVDAALKQLNQIKISLQSYNKNI